MACVLEATAPKAGNVYPGKSFDDLVYQDFLIAAEITAKVSGQKDLTVGQRVLETVRATNSATDSNVNLGIVLLLAPLIAADSRRATRQLDSWAPAVESVLAELTVGDSQCVFQAIRESSAGGLGKVDQMDVNDAECEGHILDAMKLAQGHDRIARQYATNFRDLIDTIVPVVHQAIIDAKDTILGITRCQILLLAMEPDSLIRRKMGEEIALQVQVSASEVNPSDDTSWQAFDHSLRQDGNRLNPGTTADLIAAALFILLLTDTKSS